MGRMTRTTALVCALLGLASSALAAEPPLGVQGRLQSAAGLPVPDGNYDLAVRFFPGAAGGSSLFEVKQAAVAVQSGLFDLGVTPGAALFAGQPEVWLELQVGVDPALPRTRLGAVPYALHASLADALACTGCVTTEQVAFNYAGSTQKGGPATSAADLQCTGCVGVAEMKFDADVDLAGHAITAKEFVGSGAKLTGLAAAPQGDCAPGQVVTGIGADGKLKCAVGNTYNGNDFALAGQVCAAGLMVVGIDTLGKPVCGAAAQSGQACQAGQVVTGFDAGGKAICAPGGTITGVTGSAPIVSSGGATPNLTLAQATGTANGFLASADWTAFSSKVASVAASVGGGLAAGGTATAPTLGLITTCASGQVLKWNGSVWACAADNNTNTAGTITAVTGSAPIVSSGGATPNLTMAQASASASGFLASTDWTAFSSKVASVAATTGGGLLAGGNATAPTLGLITSCASGQVLKWNGSAWACAADGNSGGTVTAVTGSAPIVSSGGATPNLTMAQANALAGGFLASADWTAFSSKVASVAASAGGGLVAGGTATAPTLGLITSCASGQVLKWNGSAWACAAEGGALPPDGLAAVSNGLLTNQFTDSFASTTTPLAIKDYFPPGQTDSIVIPDLGIAQKLTVSVDISNSDISGLTVYLYDPTNIDPLVPGYLLYDKSATGAKLATSYPDATLPKSGNLTAWVGKNPKGTWKLKVVDGVFKDGTTDGALNSWKITVQSLSATKVAVKGSLAVSETANFASELLVAGVPVARTWNASNDSLGDGAALDVATGAIDPLFAASGWVAIGTGWQQTGSASDLIASCSVCGNGSDGDYLVPAFSTVTLPSGSYQFATLSIGKGATVKVTGSIPLFIKVAGVATINGSVIVDGGAGTCSSAGIGVAGGNNGGLGCASTNSTAAKGGGSGGGSGGSSWCANGGTLSSGSGGGAGHVFAGGTGMTGTGNGGGGMGGGEGGNPYGNAQLGDGMEAGSGGGSGGGNCYNVCSPGGGGGGGGGFVSIAAARLTVGTGGLVSADGGKGGPSCQVSYGTFGGAGGGGSGGAVWLRSPRSQILGAVTVNGGATTVGSGAGSAGRIRIDGSVSGTWSGSFLAGDQTGLGASVLDRFPITQPTAGTVRLTNNSGATQKVRLVVMR